MRSGVISAEIGFRLNDPRQRGAVTDHFAE
jgi:hypothetical protein